jgi:cytochrome P450
LARQKGKTGAVIKVRGPDKRGELLMAAGSDPLLAIPDGARVQALAELAAKGPIHRYTLPSGAPAWIVTGYEEARALLRDPRIVKKGHAALRESDEGRPPYWAALNTYMLAADPPDHTRLRKLVSTAFTRQQVERLTDRIAEVCDGLLDRLAATLDNGGTVDLVGGFANPLPFTAICELIGIPPEDQAEMRQWCDVLRDPVFSDKEVHAKAATAFLDYLRVLIGQKRARPTGDLLSALVQAHDGTDRLSEDELTSMVYLLVLAGHETTAGLISNGVRALLTHPGQLAQLRAQPGLLPGAVEEILRFDSPTQSALPNFASAPVDVAGQTIAAGDTVFISLLAANRDPHRFPSPDQFDITRREQGHMSFGHGIHHCVGAPLARLEGQMALRAVIDRFPDLQLAVPAESLTRFASLIVNRLDTLPVRLAAHS